jgi:membrane-associated phospholipid phosphatase
MKTVIKPNKRYMIAIAAFLLFVLNIYAVKFLLIFGSPPLFVASLLLEVVLLIIFVYSLVRLLASPENIIKSLVLSIWNGLAENTYVKSITKSQSPPIMWFRRRLKRDTPFGLPLTITLLISLFFFVNFMSILVTVASKSSLTSVDIRILNLIPSIRTSTQTTFFRIVTTLANSETIIILMLVMASMFWKKKQKLLAGLVIVVAAGEESVTYAIKLIVQRMRPSEALRLIRENGYSFPSGHAVRATVLFGLLAYVVYKSYTSTRARILTLGLYFLSVFLVAASRIYLGVHYPTDVWGSFLLGSSILVIVIGMLEISSRYNIIGNKKLLIPNRTMLVVPVATLAFAVIASSFLVRIQPIMFTPTFVTVQSIDESTVQKLSLYSETLTGSRMEPINFIFVGYQNQIEKSFESHGWYKADPSTLNNTLRALAVGFQGGQYLRAPVTPSYLNFKPENIAFEQSTATHSLKQRHHTRLWQTGYAMPDGRPIWVATASFDEGVEFAGSAKLPTHHIDPNIDAERTYITKSLGFGNNLINVVEPQLGHNASGDGFFTDGKAEIITL